MAEEAEKTEAAGGSEEFVRRSEVEAIVRAALEAAKAEGAEEQEPDQVQGGDLFGYDMGITGYVEDLGGPASGGGLTGSLERVDHIWKDDHDVKYSTSVANVADGLVKSTADGGIHVAFTLPDGASTTLYTKLSFSFDSPRLYLNGYKVTVTDGHVASVATTSTVIDSVSLDDLIMDLANCVYTLEQWKARGATGDFNSNMGLNCESTRISVKGGAITVANGLVTSIATSGQDVGDEIGVVPEAL